MISKSKKKEYNIKYYKLNRDRLKSKRAIYRRDHRDEIIKYIQEHKEEIKQTNKIYRQVHKKEIRDKYHTDVQIRLTRLLRSRLGLAIKNKQKSGSAVKDLGCTIPELKIYLEKQFKKGMSWKNHGEWHIDHKIPLIKFNLEDRKQFLQACHFSNLQPLWATDNLSKGKKNYILDK